MTRRLGTWILLAWLALTTVSSPIALAKEDPSFAGLPLNRLLIQAADDHFVNPSVVAPGRTVISLENIGEGSRKPILVRLPGNRTLDELLAPPADPELPPDWFFEGTFVGFPGEVLPGQTRSAVVDLDPGLYVIVDNFSGVFLVDPALESDAVPVPDSAIPSSGVVDLFEYGFAFSEETAAGQVVWQVTNSGEQPHELLIVKAPSADVTVEQVMAAIISEDGTTDGFDLNDVTPVGGLSWLSPGQVAWTALDLEPGAYVAICFVYDPETGMPHAMDGMIEVFTVA